MNRVGKLFFTTILSSAFFFSPLQAAPQKNPARMAQNKTGEIYEKLGQKINLDLTFQNENGERESLRQMFAGQEALIITLNYFRCTTMCTFQFINLAEALKESGLNIGKGFRVASLSFDPTDTPERARSMRAAWTPKTGDPNAQWNFYVGEEKNISELTRSLNFFYERDDEGNYAHAAALFFIRPDGTFYRYIYGIVYDKSDIELALLDTTDGKVGSFLQKIVSRFKHYEPVRGKYIR